MAAVLRPGGRLAIGEVHVASGVPRTVAGHDLDDLAGLADEFAAAGLELTGVVGSTVADWDHYESQHWATVLAWAQAHPDHPDRSEVLDRSRYHRDQYLRETRGQMGWSILVGQRSVA
ncbi:MAG: SAM-dependent methyltransferase, partial [Pseudonocardia sp.]